MRIAIIVNSVDNDSLARFTEAKLFFDSKNIPRNLVDDCVEVSSNDCAQEFIDKNPGHTYFVIPVGAFLTTGFEKTFENFVGTMWVEYHHELVIPYDPHTYVGFKKRCEYAPRSKQLYIVENMLKSILSSHKNVYIENTDELKLDVDFSSVKHLYGLASGWKTPWIAKQIGLEKLDSVVVYDASQMQLEWAKKLHSYKQLPESMDVPHHHVGTYNIPEWTNDWWQAWHDYPVQFCKIDLLETPKFPDNSLVWISNVFKFEPLIFSLGWKRLKESRKLLLEQNKNSIIFEY